MGKKLLVLANWLLVAWLFASPVWAQQQEQQEPNPQMLIGNWVRMDGGYIIAVRSVDPEARVDAAYFNPRPINVSRAEAVVKENTAELFIELRDEGYPGSTYTLKYDLTNDALVGVYFQAVLQQSFNVMFVRLK